jgi:hypothetical protein
VVQVVHGWGGWGGWKGPHARTAQALFAATKRGRQPWGPQGRQRCATASRRRLLEQLPADQGAPDFCSCEAVLSGAVDGYRAGRQSIHHAPLLTRQARPCPAHGSPEVPAPISYSLASRSRRPVGYSLMYLR